MSTRVPVPCGAVASISIVLKKSATIQTINTLIENAARIELKNSIDITHDPIVSTDILNNNHSGTVDGQLTKINNQHLLLMAWFDNEWGYANRLLDWIVMLNR